MATKTRVPNKIGWALEDILAVCRDARGQWAMAMRRAERTMDPGLILALGRLRDELAEVERLARDARAGEYEGSGGRSG